MLALPLATLSSVAIGEPCSGTARRAVGSTCPKATRDPCIVVAVAGGIAAAEAPFACQMEDVVVVYCDVFSLDCKRIVEQILAFLAGLCQDVGSIVAVVSLVGTVSCAVDSVLCGLLVAVAVVEPHVPVPLSTVLSH